MSIIFDVMNLNGIKYMEKRACERISTKLYTGFSFDDKFYRGIVTNLSEKGMFISYRVNFPFNQSFELLILSKEKLLKIPVKVVRLIRGDRYYNAMAVEVLNPQKDYLEFVDSLRDEKKQHGLKVN